MQLSASWLFAAVVRFLASSQVLVSHVGICKFMIQLLLSEFIWMISPFTNESIPWLEGVWDKCINNQRIIMVPVMVCDYVFWTQFCTFSYLSFQLSSLTKDFICYDTFFLFSLLDSKFVVGVCLIIWLVDTYVLSILCSLLYRTIK